jgi:hypothetical protein
MMTHFEHLLPFAPRSFGLKRLAIPTNVQG